MAKEEQRKQNTGDFGVYGTQRIRNAGYVSLYHYQKQKEHPRENGVA